jgi:hypothetical protein
MQAMRIVDTNLNLVNAPTPQKDGKSNPAPLGD